MRTSSSASGTKVSLLGNATRPLVLAGPPRDIRGQLELKNPSDQKIIVRQSFLRAQLAAVRAGKAGAKSAAAPAEAVLALRRIIVRAKQSRSVPISLALDPATPAGTYEAALDVDGEQRPVVLHVTEHVAFEMTPDSLVIPNQPGEKFTRQVVVANHGNTALVIRSIGTVALDEEFQHCRALRGALDDVAETMKSFDDYFVALGRRYLKQLQFQILGIQNPKTTIPPGETRVLDLTISVSDKLIERSRYTGYAPIANGNLSFTVVPD